jgi:ParB family transcriptional regulator, chromosome partitioning protein
MGVPQPRLDASPVPLDTAEDPATAESDSDRDWFEGVIALTQDPQDAPNTLPSIDVLLGAAATTDGSAGNPTTLPLERLRPNPHPARHQADAESMARLADSIAEHGILQPLVVRRCTGDAEDFEIVVGLRRYEAAKLAGLSSVPVIILGLSDREALMVALVENLQRDDIAALDEAQCYFRLFDEFGWTQGELSRHLGRSRSHIANTLRLLGLPGAVRSLLESGMISAGHARALLPAHDPAALAAAVVARNLSVRQTEELVRREQAASVPARARLEAALSQFEQTLGERLGLRVRLQPTRRGGKVTIYYRSTDELEDALHRFTAAERAADGQPASAQSPPT